jgi:hypothetical protein
MSWTGTSSGPCLRPLGGADLPNVERHLLALDFRDRNSRFGGAVVDEMIRRYVQCIDLTRAVLVGAAGARA